MLNKQKGKIKDTEKVKIKIKTVFSCKQSFHCVFTMGNHKTAILRDRFARVQTGETT
jgi:hypothetical protein